MAVSMSCAIARLRRSSPEHLLPDESFDPLCLQAGHLWRERLFTPRITLRLFLIQILHGNTAMTHLRHLSRLGFAAASYCQARSRLPLAAMQALLAGMVDSTVEGPGRILIVDGSSFSMPDTKELRDHFGLQRCQTPGVGYPVGKVMGLLDAVTGLFVKLMMFTPFTHDMRGVIGLHESLRPGDILLGDRAFCSFSHFCLLSKAGVFGCFRLHQRRKADRLGVVRWDKPQDCPAWMTAGQFDSLPRWIDVRLVKHVIRQSGFRTRIVFIATTLLDTRPWGDRQIAELYGRRWEIETCFNHLKTTMRMNVLKCQTVEGVMKELAVYLMVYNLVRRFMLRWAQAIGVDVRRVSFIDAVRLIAARTLGLNGVAELFVNPLRPARACPRVVRRRPKKYTLLTTPRSAWKCQENQHKMR